MTISASGYAYVHMPDHPSLAGTTRKTVRRCRLVMEQVLGRPLKSWEQVHHRDGDKTNDSPENLELWVLSHPAGIRNNYCPNCDCERCKSIRED